MTTLGYAIPIAAFKGR